VRVRVGGAFRFITRPRLAAVTELEARTGVQLLVNHPVHRRQYILPSSFLPSSVRLQTAGNHCCHKYDHWTCDCPSHAYGISICLSVCLSLSLSLSLSLCVCVCVSVSVCSGFSDSTRRTAPVYRSANVIRKIHCCETIYLFIYLFTCHKIVHIIHQVIRRKQPKATYMSFQAAFRHISSLWRTGIRNLKIASVS